MISIIINSERINLIKLDISNNNFTINSIISYLNSLKSSTLANIILCGYD